MEEVIRSKIPYLVEEGLFGDVELMGLERVDQSNIGAQFASTLAFVKLSVKWRESGREETLPLVIKVQLEERMADTWEQFHMEALMYKEVLPGLGLDSELRPKLYYSDMAEGDLVLIFENIFHRGFRNSVSNLLLDSDHISLAMKTIAKFHSRSYILRQHDKAKLTGFKEKMKEWAYPTERRSGMAAAVFAAIERGVRAFERKHGHEELLGEFLKALEHPIQIFIRLVEPEESFAAICHGDFCNNNVMYRYDNKGQPVDCALLDFQLSFYGSIGVELAFFLYMHTDAESRRLYWDHFLWTYWTALREAVPEDIPVPSFDDFLGHFASRAVYGYIICAFFLPRLMSRGVPLFINISVQEQVHYARTMGGDKAEHAIMDVVSHLFHNKYVHAFLQHVNTKS